ncbi:MAG: hypothetical protein ACI3X1_06530 [Eubacteriales bacterium]
MNTMKKSAILIRVMAVLSVVMMFTMCFVGGTFAKYTSNGTGTDSTRVAKWSFKVGEADIATSDTFTFNLFNTVNDTNGTGETDIDPTDGTIIAPGTQGSFALVLTNESEVTAQYAIDYTVTNDDSIPVEFSVDGGNTWTDELADVSATTLAAKTGTTTITVQWRWAFERYTKVDKDVVTTPVSGTKYYTKSGENYVLAEGLDSFAADTDYYTIEDAADTALGINGTYTLTVAANITATQVD